MGWPGQAYPKIEGTNITYEPWIPIKNLACNIFAIEVECCHCTHVYICLVYCYVMNRVIILCYLTYQTRSIVDFIVLEYSNDVAIYLPINRGSLLKKLNRFAY